MIIALIGDDFIKNELMEKAIREKLGKDKTLDFRYGFVNWPDEPFISGEEVKEYVGREDDVLKVTADAEIVVTQLAPITYRVISSSPKLKIIGCCRGGPVNVNIRAATEKGIPVINTPGRNVVATAEFTVSMILCLLKRILPAHFNLKEGVWRGDFYKFEKCGEEIFGKKVGIVGFGRIGKKVCKILLSLGASVVVYDPYVNEEVIIEAGARPVDLKTLLKESQIVTLHARLTDKNYKLIGEKEISFMQPDSYIINVARGGLLDYDALYSALKNGKLAGAALDTYDPEPPSPDSPLLKLDNVVLTPHIGGSSKKTALNGINMLVEDISRYLQGEIPENCVNPEVFEGNKTGR